MVLKLVVYLSVIYSRISPSFFLVHLLLILAHFCLVENVIGTFSSRCFELYRKCIVFYQRCDYSLKKEVSTVQKTVKSSGTFLLTEGFKEFKKGQSTKLINDNVCYSSSVAYKFWTSKCCCCMVK